MKPKTILVCGLPGAGKTYFATRLKEALGDTAVHINGDDIRSMHNDWDFSEEGRKRQAERMKKYADGEKENGVHVILDFVCPKEEYRDIINADLLIWADRTPVREFADTTAMFEPLRDWNYRIKDHKDVDELVDEIIFRLQTFDSRRPTALMIGRYQPWHDGHTALFKKALEKHGQVCIAVRMMPKDDKNPFDFSEVCARIGEALVGYRGRYIIITVPNVVDVVYGRDVGWTVSKIDLPEEIEAISATKIREAMKNENTQT
jgi:hypothetical protein